MQPFGRNRHGPKIGGCAPLVEGERGPHLTQSRLGQGLAPYQVVFNACSRLATIEMAEIDQTAIYNYIQVAEGVCPYVYICMCDVSSARFSH